MPKILPSGSEIIPIAVVVVGVFLLVKYFAPAKAALT